MEILGEIVKKQVLAKPCLANSASAKTMKFEKDQRLASYSRRTNYVLDRSHITADYIEATGPSHGSVDQSAPAFIIAITYRHNTE